MSTGIKLRESACIGRIINGNLIRNTEKEYIIDQPSGKKITASKLQEGKHYLYKDLYKTRKIIRIDKEYDEVSYDENGWICSCSASNFARKCPYEATDEEIEFLIKENEKFRASLY